MSEEILNEIAALAEKGLTAQEVAVIVGVAEIEFVDEGSVVFKAFLKGMLLVKAKLNNQVLKLAMIGSGPAIKDAVKLLENQELEALKLNRRDYEGCC